MLKNKDSHFKAILAILASAFIGGTMSPLIKIALKEIPPLSFTFIRFLIASILILPFFIREIVKIRGNHLKAILVSFFGVVNVILFAFGVKLTTATISNTLYTASPIIVAALSYLLIQEKITKRKISGIIIGFLGAIILVLLPILGKPSAFKGDLIGNLIIVSALLSFSFYLALSKRLQSRYSPLHLTSFLMIISTLVTFPFIFIEKLSYSNWWFNLSIYSIFLTVLIGSVGTALFYFIYQYAIKHSTAVSASMSLYLQPVFAFLWAAVLLGERLTIGFIIGAILAFVGAFIVTKKPKDVINLPAE